ncbi:MAG: YggT family protein [Spirochaetaceae bacterium]|jgi:YggT family protein|nr:YggT family protein [Spirochaetaceae bacterium]
MTYVTSVLAGIISVYMFLIFIRIILTWFPGANFGGPFMFLCHICDPYLTWFRRFRPFKNSPIDFSPLIALAVLSLFHRLLLLWGSPRGSSLGALLILLLNAVWSLIAWILGFFIVILILRMVAYLGNYNIYSPFWRFVDLIAQPLMYRISSIFFPSRIVHYLFRILFSIIILAAAAVLLWGIFHVGARLLLALL